MRLELSFERVTVRADPRKSAVGAARPLEAVRSARSSTPYHCCQKGASPRLWGVQRTRRGRDVGGGAVAAKQRRWTSS